MLCIQTCTHMLCVHACTHMLCIRTHPYIHTHTCIAGGQAPFDTTTPEFRKEPLALSLKWFGWAGQARCSRVYAGAFNSFQDVMLHASVSPHAFYWISLSTLPSFLVDHFLLGARRWKCKYIQKVCLPLHFTKLNSSRQTIWNADFV
jgi:hypothetical protein